MFIKKAVAVIKQKNRFVRVMQAANKSPLRFFTKALAVVSSPRKFLVRRMKAMQIKLSSVELAVVQQLESLGYAEITEFISKENLEELSSYCLEKLKRAEEIRKREILKSKDFWIMLSDEDIADKNLTAENPLVKFALQQNLLRVVGAYLKQSPFIEYVCLTLSKYTPGPLKSSQLWHRDYDNTRMLKMFVYLTDVGSVDSGPFTFVNASDSEQVKNNFITRHLPDEEIFNFVPKSSVNQMIRPKLTCFAVDTYRCYHMGSRLTEGHQRLMYTALFSALPSNYPWAGREKYKATEGLDEMQLMALKPMP